MRVCLINPRFPKSQFLVMNQGLLQLAAEVKRAGHSCEILDFTDRAQAFSPDHLKRFDLVGLSVMTAQLWHAVEIAEALSPHVKVAWGGVHCLLDPLSILNGFPDREGMQLELQLPHQHDMQEAYVERFSLFARRELCHFPFTLSGDGQMVKKGDSPCTIA